MKAANTTGLDSTLMTCAKCGEETHIVRDTPFGRKKLPVACKCKRAEYDKAREEEAKREKQIKLRRLKEYSLMDKMFETCTFENWEKDSSNEKWFKMAEKYADNFKDMKKENIGFMLYGPAGAGKTYMVSAIANRLMERLTPVIVISSLGILNKIKDNYGRYGSEGEVQIINSLKTASLLVIDDLGAENNTEWATTTLYQIVDSRYRNNKPMIVTTNLSPEKLQEKLGQRTYDRISEMCVPMKYDGTSRRVSKGRDKATILREMLKG